MKDIYARVQGSTNITEKVLTFVAVPYYGVLVIVKVLTPTRLLSDVYIVTFLVKLLKTIPAGGTALFTFNV